MFMQRFKSVINIFATVIYGWLCLRSCGYYAYSSVEFIYDFFAKLGFDYKNMVDINEYSVFPYLTLLVFGIAAFIILTVAYRKNKNYLIPLIVSSVPNISLFALWYGIPPIHTPRFFAVLYWIFAVWSLAGGVYVVAVLIKELRKNTPCLQTENS